MEDNKKEVKQDKKEEVKVEKTENKNDAKFKQVDKKEAKKIKDKKEPKQKTGKKTWIPTAITVVIVLAVIALLTVMIVASSNPRKSVEGLLTNLKAGDFEKAKEFVSGGEDVFDTTGLDEETQKLLFEKLNWKITKVTEETDKATVEVEITNKDFQTVVNNYAKRALDAAREILGGNTSTSITEQDFKNYFLEELRSDQIQTTTVTKTINVVREDKKWKVVSDEALEDALLPGLQEAIDTLA